MSNGFFADYHSNIDGEFDSILSRIAPPAPRPDRRIPDGGDTTAWSVPATVTKVSAPELNRLNELDVSAAATGLSEDELKASRGKPQVRATTRAALSRLERIRPALENILQQEGVPPRLAAVVLVESGARPMALSPKSARGLWQFIPETARRYGLVVDKHRDDRIELEPATRAAARYLRDLYQMFGTWRLALAAYNAGEGAVQRALNRAGADNFQEISDRKLIPAETRAYVPKVLAAMNLLTPGGER